jgi:hypothetical protein
MKTTECGPVNAGEQNLVGPEIQSELPESWSVTDGEFDSENSGIDSERIKEMKQLLLDLRNEKSDDAYKRVLGYQTISYAAELAMPELFSDKDLATNIQDDIAQACIKYWTYGEDELREVKQLAEISTEDLPILRALQIVTLELNRQSDESDDPEEEKAEIPEDKLVVPRSKRQLIEGIVRVLYLEKEKPEIRLPIPPKLD